MKKTTSRRLRGFTLTEAAIVLGIVGLILGAIWVAAGSVYSNMRVQTTTTQVLQTVSGIRALYATASVIDNGDLSNTATRAGAVPKDMIVDTTAAIWTLRNVWGGAATVVGDNANNRFTITLADVPQEACSNLVMRMTGQGRDSGLHSIKGSGPVQTTFPVSLADSQLTCTAGNNAMAIVFNLRS